ncbi:hypothetical protein [Pseudomonas mosselii]|uniref:hypothetical protein n=1 Tax=Pseudomonas mosselii TaxID=78327 RepID=UPI00300BFB87
MTPTDTKRDLIPIWKSTRDAAHSPELQPVKTQKPPPLQEPTTPGLLKEFIEHKNLGIAANLFNIATLENDTTATTIAAEFILNHPNSPPALISACHSALKHKLNSHSTTDVHLFIHATRKSLKDNVKNPLAWVDLSRAYATINEREKSERAMWSALHLTSNHRWISRMAARLFIHLEDTSKAQYALTRNENLKNDPWLLSTDLVLSRLSNRPLKHWKIAKNLVESSIKPIHLSELSSSLATTELINGASKKARNYFKQSLIAPTSNSLAQVKWADRSFLLGFSTQIENSLAVTANAFEAKYLEAYDKKDMFSALRYAMQWWEEEPYSSAPPQAIAYLAALTNDIPLLKKVSKESLQANPNDNTIQLNYIFSLLCDLRYTLEFRNESLEPIIKTLRTIMDSDEKSEAAHASANIGLIAYRLGQFDTGKMYYNWAASYYEKASKPAMLYLLVNHLRESLIAECSWSTSIKDQIKKQLQGANAFSAPAAEYYLANIEDLEKLPGPWIEKLSKPFAQPTPNNNEIKPTPVERKILSLDDMAEKFWLPQDILTTNELLRFLKNEKPKN